MAYTVLARRYRSSTFDQVVGQEHIAQTLKRAIESGRIAHAYLFCGTRGTGKTSTARILAKCLNCQSADHPVTVPCDRCDSCRSISRGDDIDVIEIDAASNTGVDDVRDTIIGTAYNMPARSRFKIFIIDEVHMLSKNAFNALLKTLEEPPSHVKFILATTEPEKVLPTILSRCQRYDFRNIPSREVASHLKQISASEKIDADDDALLLVAKAGAGSMRDSLSLLDRLLSLGETRLTVEMIESLLGLPRIQVLFNLAGAIGDGDTKAVLSQTEAIVASGLSVDTVVASLIDHLRNLLVLRTCGADSDLVEVPGLAIEELATQAERFDAGALSQDIVILEELRRHVRQSQAGRALLDATLVRMTLADQFSSLEQLLDRTAGGAGGAAAGSGAQKKKPAAEVRSSAVTPPPRAPSPPPPPPPPPPSPPTPSPPPPSPTVTEPTPASPLPPTAPVPSVTPFHPPIATELLAADLLDDDDSDLPGVGKVWDKPTESLATIMSRTRANAPLAPAPPPVEPVPLNDLPSQQRALLALLATKAPGLHGIVSQGEFVGVQDGQAVIRLSKNHETFVRRLDQNGKKELLREVASSVLNQSVGVRFDLIDPGVAASPVNTETASPGAAVPPTPIPAPPPPGPAPVTPSLRVTDELRQQLYQENPLVRAVVEQFGGKVINLEPQS